MGIPPNRPFQIGIFHEINHPLLAWGTPIYGKPLIYGNYTELGGSCCGF